MGSQLVNKTVEIDLIFVILFPLVKGKNTVGRINPVEVILIGLVIGY